MLITDLKKVLDEHWHRNSAEVLVFVNDRYRKVTGIEIADNEDIRLYLDSEASKE